jgi:hypothetical protein
VDRGIKKTGDPDEPVGTLSQLRDLWERHAPTFISLVILILLATIFYFWSMWSALHLSRSARMLADTARKVAAQRGDEDTLQRELLIQLSDIQRRDDFSEALLHISISFVVAIIIIVTVELYSASRTRREILEYRDSIAHEVWTALSGRLVPSEIVDEIRGILKADVVKEDARYVLTFMRHDGMPSDTIVLQRKLTYILRNVTGRRVIHTIRSTIHSVRPDVQCQEKSSGAKMTLPRHREFKIDGRVVDLVEGLTLFRNARNQLRDLRFGIELGRKHDSAEIFFLTEEPVPISGDNTYMQTVPVTGLTVSIENKIDDLIKVREVDLAHPNYQEFVAGPDGVFRYPGGILPGQSFTIAWEQIRPSGQATDRNK